MTLGNKLVHAVIVWITLGLPLNAQQALPGAAGWKGVLRNAAGKPLSGATIELIGPSGHKDLSLTQSDGAFLFSQLPPDLFTLFVTVDGHRIAYPHPVTLETSDVILTLSSEGTLALQAAPAEKETAAGVVLSSQSVSQLPLNKRDVSREVWSRRAPWHAGTTKWLIASVYTNCETA